jgi:hemerythrin-like domain-containing protein
VIPALHASGDAVAVAIADRMLAEHAEIRAGWAALRPLLETLAAGTLPDAATLQAAVRRFVAVHDAHLRLEDDLAFPRAALCIDSPEALQAMGAEMARRRGVSSP